MTAVTTTKRHLCSPKLLSQRKKKKKIQLARHYSDPSEGSEASKSTAGVPAAGVTKDE